MNLDPFRRRRAERFAQLLDEATGGPRHHARARDDAQLAELVAVGHQLSTARPAAEVGEDFRVGLRAMLIATAEREGIGVTDRQPEPVRDRGPVSHVRTAAAARPLRARGAIIIGVAAGALAVSGMSAASENALPGDALYAVKRSTERAQLALASSEVTRGQLFLDFARSRLAEAGAASGDAPGLRAGLADMDSHTRQGVRLLTTSAVQRKDPTPLNAIDRFVAVQRRQMTPLLARVEGANAQRARESMALLDDVDRRARALRDTLPCGAERAVADSLGPRPRACWSAPGGAAPATRTETDERPDTAAPRKADPEPTAGDPGPQPAERAANPTVRQAPVTRQQAPPVADVPVSDVGPDLVAPSPLVEPPAPEPAEDDGVLGDIGRMFGGILG